MKVYENAMYQWKAHKGYIVFMNFFNNPWKWVVGNIDSVLVPWIEGSSKRCWQLLNGKRRVLYPLHFHERYKVWLNWGFFYSVPLPEWILIAGGYYVKPEKQCIPFRYFISDRKVISWLCVNYDCTIPRVNAWLLEAVSRLNTSIREMNDNLLTSSYCRRRHDELYLKLMFLH